MVAATAFFVPAVVIARVMADVDGGADLDDGAMPLHEDVAADAEAAAVRAHAVTETASFYAEVKALVNAEAARQAADWEFLLAANDLFARRFSDVEASASELAARAVDVQARLAGLPEFVRQLEDLESNLSVIESVAHGLDEYARVLEQRVGLPPAH